jgi:hypothetical protein
MCGGGVFFAARGSADQRVPRDGRLQDLRRATLRTPAPTESGLSASQCWRTMLSRTAPTLAPLDIKGAIA